MANLTSQLSDVRPVDNIVSAAGTHSTGLATGLEAIASGIHTVSSVIDQRAQSRRQAASDARAQQAADQSNIRFNQEQSDRAARDLTVREVVSSLNAPVPETAAPTEQPTYEINDPAFRASLEGAGKQLTSAQAAVNQGKLPPLALQAQSESLLRSILIAHPDYDASVVASQAEKLGINAFRAYKSATTELDDQEKTKREDRNKYVGVYNSFIAPVPGMEEPSDDEKYVQGRAIAARQAQAEVAMKAAQAQRESTQYAQGQSDREDLKTADVMVNSSVDLFHAALGPTVTQIQKALMAAPEPGKDASYDTHAAKTQGAIRFAINNAVNQVIQNLPKNMKPEAISSLKKQLLDDAEQNLITPFTTRYGDFKQAADAFQTHTGLAMAESYPMLAQMKALGIDYQNQKQLLDAIPQGTWKSLAGELSGAGTRSLNQNIGKIHLDRAIAIAKGELNVTEVSDAGARKQLLSQAYNTSVNGAAAVAAGRGDPKGWGHNYAQIVLSTGGVKAADGVDVLSRALSVSARGDVRTAIEKMKADPATAEQGDLLAHASRASVGHVVQQSRAALESLAKQQYFNLRWNENGSQFSLAPDMARWKRDHPKQSDQSVARFGYLPGHEASAPQASKDLVGLARNMNEGLTFLVNTTKWDPDAPRGTNRELANLYAVGTPTAAMKTARASKTPGSSDPQRLLDLVDQSLSKVTDLVPQGNTGGSRGERNNNPGNLEDSAFTKSQPGYKGSDGRFAQFATPAHGEAAQEKLLAKNYIEKGYNTVQKIIGRYAPRSDNAGSFDNYVAYVAKKLNINPSDTLTPAMTGKLASAMREFETGNRSA